METSFFNHPTWIMAIIIVLILFFFSYYLVQNRRRKNKINENNLKVLAEKDEQIKKLIEDREGLLQQISEYESIIKQYKYNIERHNTINMDVMKAFIVKSSEKLLQYSPFIEEYVTRNPLLEQANIFISKFNQIEDNGDPKILVQELKVCYDQFKFDVINEEFKRYLFDFYKELTKPLNENAEKFNLGKYTLDLNFIKTELNSFIDQNIKEYYDAYLLLSGEYFERYKKIVNPSAWAKLGSFIKNVFIGTVDNLIKVFTGTDTELLNTILNLRDLNNTEFVKSYASAIEFFIGSIDTGFSKELLLKFEKILSEYQLAYITQNANILEVLNHTSLEGKNISQVYPSLLEDICLQPGKIASGKEGPVVIL